MQLRNLIDEPCMMHPGGVAPLQFRCTFLEWKTQAARGNVFARFNDTIHPIGIDRMAIDSELGGLRGNLNLGISAEKARPVALKVSLLNGLRVFGLAGREK